MTGWAGMRRSDGGSHPSPALKVLDERVIMVRVVSVTVYVRATLLCVST
jgi:hypothetical protein